MISIKTVPRHISNCFSKELVNRAEHADEGSYAPTKPRYEVVLGNALQPCFLPSASTLLYQTFLGRSRRTPGVVHSNTGSELELGEEIARICDQIVASANKKSIRIDAAPQKSIVA